MVVRSFYDDRTVVLPVDAKIDLRVGNVVAEDEDSLFVGVSVMKELLDVWEGLEN